MSDQTNLSSDRLGKLLGSRIYDCNAAAITLRSDLSQLPKLNKLVDNRQKLFGVLCLLSFLSLLAALSKGSFVVAAGLAFVFFVSQWVRWLGKSLANERFMLAERLLELFGRDMIADGLLHLRLAFDKITASNNKVKTRRHDRNRFESTWLVLSGRYADGSKFSLQVTEIFEIKRRKNKQKPKGYVVKLTLAFSKKKYGDLQFNHSALTRKIKVQASASLKSAKAKGNVLSITAKRPEILSLKASAISEELCLLVKFLLLSSYEILNSEMKRINPAAS